VTAVDVIPVPPPGPHEERVVQRVLGPRQAAEEIAAPAHQRAQARAHTPLHVVGERTDAAGVEKRRRDRVLPAEPWQAEHALRVVVPLRMVRRRRLHERASVDDEVFIPRRPSADHVRVER